MAPIPAVVVTGFHRSGTSMAMQSLVNAGLYAGDSLVGATATNQDGHYEDVDSVKLHDTWLAENQFDWCYQDGLPTVKPQQAVESIRQIAARLSCKGKAWGIKDPRAALFLKYWFSSLDNPYGVFVYRHYASCLASLQRRQAYELFKHPSTQHNAIRLWVDPNIALKSWILHNNAMLEIMSTHPDRCVLVSQEAQLANTSLVNTVKSRFPIDLLSTTDAGIDKSKTSLIANIPLSATNRTALLETWDALQQASTAPADKVPNVEWCESNCPANVRVAGINDSSDMDTLGKLWDELDISPKNFHAN